MSKITVKTIHRQGAGVFQSDTMQVDVAVKKVGSLYQVIVDGRFTGMTRVLVEEAYELLSSYLGATLQEDPNFGKKEVKKRKRVNKVTKEK